MKRPRVDGEGNAPAKRQGYVLVNISKHQSFSFLARLVSYFPRRASTSAVLLTVILFVPALHGAGVEGLRRPRSVR